MGGNRDIRDPMLAWGRHDFGETGRVRETSTSGLRTKAERYTAKPGSKIQCVCRWEEGGAYRYQIKIRNPEIQWDRHKLACYRS